MNENEKEKLVDSVHQLGINSLHYSGLNALVIGNGKYESKPLQNPKMMLMQLLINYKI